MADSSTGSDSADRRGRRDIVVPMRLYKTIVVFSTMIAAICILGGFFLLDAATLQVSVFRRILELGFGAIGLGVSDDVLSAVLAVAGLGTIAFGTAVYVLGTRFRAAGMGKSQEDSNEDSTNG